jgi:hypothetical protein
MNKDSPAFSYFVKNCTFEQVQTMQATVEGLYQIGVFYLPLEALHEALIMGSTSSGIETDPFLEEEKNSIFDIIKNKEGKASIYALEELCSYIEKYIYGEENYFNLQNEDYDKEEVFDLGNIDLGLDSDDEDHEDKNGLIAVVQSVDMITESTING